MPDTPRTLISAALHDESPVQLTEMTDKDHRDFLPLDELAECMLASIRVEKLDMVCLFQLLLRWLLEGLC